jgi:hypothetical protein
LCELGLGAGAEDDGGGGGVLADQGGVAAAGVELPGVAAGGDRVGGVAVGVDGDGGDERVGRAVGLLDRDVLLVGVDEADVPGDVLRVGVVVGDRGGPRSSRAG